MTALVKLLELDQLARQDAGKFDRRRDLFSIITAKSGRHFIGIAGPRGVGKTILLKQLALAIPSSLYLSADALDTGNLFDIAKAAIEKFKITALMVDEIHFQKDFSAHLKKIYDFLNVRVFFTSSVALSLHESGHDLSRRAEIVNLHPFSFREYLSFRQNAVLPALSLEDILNKRWTPEHLRFEFAFNEYLKGGLMPYAMEEPDPLAIARNILNTVILRDIPAVAKLHTDELDKVRKMVEFIGRSASEDINYSTIARNLGITKYKSESYIRLLDKAYILNPVFPAGTNVLKEPKVLICLPFRLLFLDYDKAVGALREDFFAGMMKITGHAFQYLKSTRGAKTPDFLVKINSGDLVIEIGGRGKGREQFKGFRAERKLIFGHGEQATGEKRPLFLLGYLA